MLEGLVTLLWQGVDGNNWCVDDMCWVVVV